MFRDRRREPKDEAKGSGQVTTSVDDAWKTLSLVNDWIKHGETKASVSFAAAGVSGGLLFNIAKSEVNPSCLFVMAAIICGLCIAATGIFAGAAISPRLNPKDDPTNVLYFDHIARKHKKSHDEYGALLAQLIRDRDRLILEIASQVWANAHVAKRKYKWGGLAMISLICTVAFLAISATLALLT